MSSTTKLAIFSVVISLVSADCGMPAIAPDVSSKIVGGTNANPGSWPWQGVFKYKSAGSWWGGSSYRFICGGSLIAPGWFMTAAHCVDGDLTASDYEVVLGVYDRHTPGSNQQTMQVQHVYEYSKYDSGTTSFDIALIKLATPATLSAQVSTVCLPQNDSTALAGGQSVWVTGWGTTSEGGSVSNTLRQVAVPIVPTETCSTEYNGDIVPECMFCAGAQGIDSCQGDSGGPVVQQASNGKWYQYGIVSWGYGCAEKAYAGVYSKVTDYCQFITSTTNGEVSCQA